MRRGLVFLAAVAAAAALAAPAAAVAPTLLSVTSHNGWVVATFSSPRSWLGTLYLATDPTLVDDGAHFAHPVGELDITDAELAAGRADAADHTSEFGARVDPGTYWALLSVTAQNDCKDADLHIDPSCANGGSNLLQVTIGKPTARYRALVTYFEGGIIVLELQVARSGERKAYTVCWHRRNGKQVCRGNTIEGGGWWSNDFDGQSAVQASRRGLAKFTRFVWTVDGKVVASKRVRTNLR